MDSQIEHLPSGNIYNWPSANKISPSQAHNFWSYFRSVGLSFFLIWLFFALPVAWRAHWAWLPVCLSVIALQAAWRWADLACLSYRFEEERVVWSRGVFSRNSGSLEMFRVQTVTMYQGFFERLMGIGCVLLETQDPTNPYVRIIGMTQPDLMREWLTIHVQRARRARGLREFAIG